MNKDKILTFQQVGLAYRRNISPFSKKSWVLHDLTFELYRNEVLGVIGRNGAGKSTLLKLLANIISPDVGAIHGSEGVRSQLLTLSLGFNNQLSGYENALMSSVTLGKSVKETKALMPSIIEFSEIGHLMKHAVGTYSAGERARLGFAIAIQTTPDILLLDEILGVGDKDFKEKSSKELKKIIRSDQTAVLVSHQPSTLKEFCERVIWIENGTIKMLGDAEPVLSAYKDSSTPLRA
jgi:lipopolysaccharide transport system ATP-binding protein